MISFVTTFISHTIIYTTVYSIAALGVLIAGRAGIFNVSAEGVMLSSASLGFVVAYLTGNWVWGFIFAFLLGGVFGLIFAFIHETFKVNQFILGISLIIVGYGLSDLLYKLVIGITLSAPIAPSVPIINIPWLSKVPIISGFINHDAIVYLMYFASLVSWWFYYKTKLGLETRAIGESPKAADVVGVNVARRRYLATIIGSALVGVSGAYMPIVITGTYSSYMIGGRGFMAIAIAIFASWKPQRAFLGGFLFAVVEVIASQLQLTSKNVPFQFFLMLPFILVLVIMMIFKKKFESPASVGEPYSRE